MEELRLTLSISDVDRALLSDLIDALKGAKADRTPAAEPVKETVTAEAPKAVEFTPVDEPDVPFDEPTKEVAITVDDVKKLTMDLVRSDKREKAKAIVKKYATRVQDIPSDKIADAYNELVELKNA